ncbi:MAG: hypothetical protein OXF61_15110, partial [Acidimicrobiaceae bacterium]|nr:hypothetical protein [Acidimicrobiaceae bacterium]
MATSCTFDTLSPQQAQQKRRCLEAADATIEAAREFDDAYSAAEGMMEGVVPTRGHQALYSAFVEADERWRHALDHALTTCGAAVAANSEDDELRKFHERLLALIVHENSVDRLFGVLCA